ncbi:hypothetical protein L7F22_033105 [Adiantum nelumboides]|nr:hypothetical protein [Adiantum nelumboides]
MTKIERKFEYNKLKKTLKDVWTTEMEMDDDTNLDKMDVPSHYKKYTIQDRNIIVQQLMRELKEPGTSYDGPKKAKKIDVAEPGEEPKPAYIATDLIKEEEQLLIATLKQYRDVFAWSYKDLKGLDISICQHTIPLKSDAKPSRQRPYTYNETFARKIKEEIDKLKEAEFIYEIEHTDWVSPIVVVLKKNEKLRVCVNLKKVNVATIRDNYPLPITDHVIERVVGREAYSFLDGFSGYNQLATKLEDQHKMAFATEWGIFAYRDGAYRALDKSVREMQIISDLPKPRKMCLHEQRAAQLAREKIKEALSRKAKEPILEPSQGSPKRPKQEDEEEMEHIQADPIPSSPMNIPLAPPSSLITPFPPASTPRTPPSPTTLNPPRSPPAPASSQQQQPSAEPSEIPPSTQEEKDQSMDRAEEEKKQADTDKSKPVDIELQIPLMQLEEPSHEEAYEEVKNFHYTKIILTLSRQFKCQQVVAKETDFEKERANRAYEEVANLRIALELSQLTKKEAQNHELIKNEKKMKKQLKYEDARFQKVNTSYNTVKGGTLTALLQNQEPAAATTSTSNSATMNTIKALQEELQTEKLQRQLLVSGFMSQTAQHEAKVKELEQELAHAKADLEIQKQQIEALNKGKEAMRSFASTSQISQAETHLHIQLPPMSEMPDFPSTQEEE